MQAGGHADEVAATDAAFKYYSHRQDGAVEAMSAMPDQDLISGTGGANIDFSGIAFMPLPEQPDDGRLWR